MYMTGALLRNPGNHHLLLSALKQHGRKRRLEHAAPEIWTGHRPAAMIPLAEAFYRSLIRRIWGALR
ncbi:hypothetical protein CI238_00432 [Colletotrichum incanum]|uniref:Uncharacterized protein n=1 Tax=Colletotrichum incanum TaxID=1573173 RepID=A0A167BJM8_COLIC|nr:hypothetical protein CI238_00432 [Colletotrichum incanum]